MLLEAHRPMTVGAVADRLSIDDFVPRGRASKSISEALRKEVGKGRVIRLRRNLYCIDTVPRSTKSRIRGHVQQLHAIRISGLDGVNRHAA